MFLRHRVSLQDFCRRYALEKGLRPGSAKQYLTSITSLEKWAGRRVFVDDLHATTVNEWIVAIEESGLSRSTVHNRVRHLLALWRYARRHQLCRNGLTGVRRIRRPRLTPRAWPIETVRLILQASRFQRGQHDNNGLTRAEFWGLVIRLGWDTGMRWCDLKQLTPHHLEGDAVALVQQKTDRLHVAKLHASTLAALDRSGAMDRSRFLPWDAQDETFRRAFRELVESCGLRGTFKKLRSSAATNCELNHPGCGGAFLGHASVFSTVARQSYLDPRILAENLPQPQEL